MIFDPLRSLVLASLAMPGSAFHPDLVPIEQTVDGWFCLSRTGSVVHATADGSGAEIVRPASLALALVGKLSRLGSVRDLLM